MLIYIKKKISEQIDQYIDKREEESFVREIENFRKHFKSVPFDYKIQFIREFAKYISAKKSIDLLKGVKGNITCLIKNYFKKIPQVVETTENTIYITNINRADRFTSLCDKYALLLNEFEQNNGHKGYYLKEFDIAFITNGNHSINHKYIFSQVKLTTNNFFEYIEIDETFLDKKIYSARKKDNIFEQYIDDYNKDMVLVWIAIQEYLIEKNLLIKD